MKESRKEFIKKAHSAACSDWKTNIEKEFPKLFKKDALVVGKWYKRKQDSRLWFVTHIKNGCSYGYGFDYSGYWADESAGFNYSLELNKATDKEVEQALIKEAEKRGFEEGVAFKSVSGRNSIDRVCDGFRYYSNQNQLCSGKGSVFIKGKWATIIEETITKEQAEKELGKTILN